MREDKYKRTGGQFAIGDILINRGWYTIYMRNYNTF